MKDRGRATPKFRWGIRNKAIVLSCAVVAVFCSSGLIFMNQSTRQAARATSAAQKQGQVTITKLLDLFNQGYEIQINEWTYWDEMIDFVKKPTKTWAENTFAEPIKKHRIACVCTFDKDWNLTYESAESEGESDVPHETLLPLLKPLLGPGRPFAHFYVKSGENLVEIRAATVHKGDDQARKGPSYGYLVTSRIWGKPFITAMSELTGAYVSLREPGWIMPQSSEQSAYSVSIPLKGAKGDTVAEVVFKKVSDEVLLTVTSARKAALLFVALALIVSLLFFLLVQRWVIGPVYRLALSLNEGNPEMVSDLVEGNDEFAALGKTIYSHFEQQSELQAMNEELVSVLEELGNKNQEMAVINQELDGRVEQRTQELEFADQSTIIGWSKAMDARDHDTEGHTQRVTKMAVAIGEAMNLEPTDLRRIYFGGLLHDIGKIGIPDSVLLKPGKLTHDEFATMQQHTLLAYDMLKTIPFLADCLDIPLSHHEKWDGTGYPLGVAAGSIPLVARIFAVADVWDALRSDRPYRKSWDEQRTRDYIESCSGTHFDPEVVRVFLQMPPMAHPSDEPEAGQIAA